MNFLGPKIQPDNVTGMKTLCFVVVLKSSCTVDLLYILSKTVCTLGLLNLLLI